MRSQGVFRRLVRSDEPFLVPPGPGLEMPRYVVPVRAGGEWLGSIWAVIDRTPAGRRASPSCGGPPRSWPCTCSGTAPSPTSPVGSPPSGSARCSVVDRSIPRPRPGCRRARGAWSPSAPPDRRRPRSASRATSTCGSPGSGDEVGGSRCSPTSATGRTPWCDHYRAGTSRGSGHLAVARRPGRGGRGVGLRVAAGWVAAGVVVGAPVDLAASRAQRRAGRRASRRRPGSRSGLDRGGPVGEV